MNDITEKLSCGTLIQHGHLSDRIYVLKVSNNKIISLPARLIDLAKKNGYGKICVKVNEVQSLPFINHQFTIEARVPKMFPRSREGIFLAYYLNPDRRHEESLDLYKRNLDLAKKKKLALPKSFDKSIFKIRACHDRDISFMKEIYKVVFATYPFPIHNEKYLLDTMNDNVDYFCVESHGEIVALSSAERDVDSSYVEMTDFATLPQWQGNGLALQLLKRMENEMKKLKIRSSFTIARAASAGMNITFSKSGYRYGGRLKNNTNISGNIESMNIWHKTL